ncbi:hypothetical protein G6O67_001819 [Ophiocordyceps sinensis]|uniref:Ectonucleotide pyrophosphatase/phosphodiesterase family member 1 n=1 Tax=Ophiocordyceps sinensis TaxID=72228 RepID=A0A8H4V6M4_9HYPO|nr:hypothetical protein G6O67_001819 [Ophiocordyceps sinensis]
MSPNRLDRHDPNAPDRDNRSLLSPVAYDDDASSLHSRSDQDTDSEDDQLQQRARNSRELRAHDRIVLMQEEEMDQLVTSSRREQQQGQRRGSGLAVPNPFKMFGRNNSLTNLSAAGSSTEDLVVEKRKARRARRKQKRHRLTRDARHGEDGELMYEMEEGGIKDGSSTGDSTPREDSDEVDRRRLGLVASSKAARGRSWRRSIFIHLLIAIGFSMLVLIAWKLSKNRKGGIDRQRLISNGTALFAPTTIIISLDGFRADFLQRGLTPRLTALIEQGISPRYMLPSFPSVTFPNHYTLATGLYPESHGIVGNSFWDPQLQAEFYYTDPKRSLDPKWWGGEPFWATAERQGIRTAVHMWPGSEAHILRVEPSFVDKFDGKEKLPKKAARILELLDMPGREDGLVDMELTRPQLIAAYVPNIDADGHKFGPNTTEVRSTIQEVDVMLDQLWQGLHQRNLTDVVNIIIVSDHGMATTDTSRLIQLEDLVNTSKIEHTDGWPLYGLRPKDRRDLQELYQGVKQKSKSNPNFDVYLRDVDMPERYHFSNNDRIAPLWIVPKTGWAIVKLDEFNVEEGKKKGLVYHPRGLHGYDHEHPLMRAIFVAHGPAFPHPANSRVEPFQNIEVYNILADSIGMEPKPNNGTLRLPLKPTGTHRPEDMPAEPADPPPSPTPQPLNGPQRPVLNEGPEEPDRPTLPPRPTQGAQSNATSESTVNGTGNTGEEEGREGFGWFKDHVQGGLDWVAERAR